MRDKHLTDGKVTYIHGATPKRELPIQSMAQFPVRPGPPSTLVERVDEAAKLGRMADELGILKSPARPTLEEVAAAQQATSEWSRRDPDGYRRYLGSIGVTREMLEAGEQDISQHAYEFPPEGLKVRPDAPSVHQYLGLDVGREPAISAPHEADEWDIWSAGINRSTGHLDAFDWHVIVSLMVVILLIAAAIAGIVYFAQFYSLADFPGTLLNPPPGTP